MAVRRPAEHMVLQLAKDASWLASAGLPVTGAQIATLQRMIDVDDMSSRNEFLQTVLGPVPDGDARQLARSWLAVVVENLRTFGTYGLSITAMHRSGLRVLSFSPANVRDRLENLCALGLDLSMVMKRPRTLAHDVQTVREKVGHLTGAGVQPAAIATHPKLLDLASDSVDAKLAYLADLGVQPVPVVNAFPAVLSLRTHKLGLTALICREARAWEALRTAWNAGQQLQVMTVPVTSLALMAGIDPANFAANPFHARKFVQDQGWTTPEQRRQALVQRLVPVEANRGFLVNLGLAGLALDAEMRGRQPMEHLVGVLGFAAMAGIGSQGRVDHALGG